MKKIGWEKIQDPSEELDDLVSDLKMEMSEMMESGEDDDHAPMPMPTPIIEFDDMVVKTPIGTYSIDDPFSPYKMFDCWICHANFPITDKEFLILEDDIEGLGCLKVISKYTFFIGIEKMFTFADVRVDIEKKLCGESAHSSSKIDSTLFKLKRYKKWACFISNEGEMEMIAREDCDSDDEFDDHVSDLKNKKGGNIITYETN